jgi:hypothetical protein
VRDHEAAAALDQSLEAMGGRALPFAHDVARTEEFLDSRPGLRQHLGFVPTLTERAFEPDDPHEVRVAQYDVAHWTLPKAVMKSLGRNGRKPSRREFFGECTSQPFAKVLPLSLGDS